jgi:hypothetical protein
LYEPSEFSRNFTKTFTSGLAHLSILHLFGGSVLSLKGDDWAEVTADLSPMQARHFRDFARWMCYDIETTPDPRRLKALRMMWERWYPPDTSAHVHDGPSLLLVVSCAVLIGVVFL